MGSRRIGMPGHFLVEAVGPLGPHSDYIDSRIEQSSFEIKWGSYVSLSNKPAEPPTHQEHKPKSCQPHDRAHKRRVEDGGSPEVLSQIHPTPPVPGHSNSYVVATRIEQVLPVSLTVHPTYDSCLPQLPVRSPPEPALPSPARAGLHPPDVLPYAPARVACPDCPLPWSTSISSMMGKSGAPRHPSAVTTG